VDACEPLTQPAPICQSYEWIIRRMISSAATALLARIESNQAQSHAQRLKNGLIYGQIKWALIYLFVSCTENDKNS